MLRQNKACLNDMNAAPHSFACLQCSFGLAWSCLGWLQKEACAALKALLQGACMTLASQLGSGRATLSSADVEEGSMEPQLWVCLLNHFHAQAWGASGPFHSVSTFQRKSGRGRGPFCTHRGHTSMVPLIVPDCCHSLSLSCSQCFVVCACAAHMHPDGASN